MSVWTKWTQRLFRTGSGGSGEAASAIDYATLVDRAMDELRLKTQAAVGLFRVDEARWDVDLKAGAITFTAPDGLVATAPVQVVGTLDAGDSTWLWSWANPSIPESATRHARIVREFGEKHRIADLTRSGNFPVRSDESDCWRFAALACHLGEAQGAYRGPAGDVRVFMTYGTVTLQKGSP